MKASADHPCMHYSYLSWRTHPKQTQNAEQVSPCLPSHSLPKRYQTQREIVHQYPATHVELPHTYTHSFLRFVASRFSLSSSACFRLTSCPRRDSQPRWRGPCLFRDALAVRAGWFPPCACWRSRCCSRQLVGWCLCRLRAVVLHHVHGRLCSDCVRWGAGCSACSAAVVEHVLESLRPAVAVLRTCPPLFVAHWRASPPPPSASPLLLSAFLKSLFVLTIEARLPVCLLLLFLDVLS